MIISKATKKPVTIECMLLTEETADEVLRWLKEHDCIIHGAPQGINIPTLEGIMHADWGDYIIKGIKGEFYPCKPDIFLATYEIQTEAQTEVQTEAHKDKMTFAQMIKAIKDGKIVMRESQPGLHMMFKRDSIGFPSVGVRRVLEDGEAGGIYPYVPAQDDIEADDWVVVK